MELRRHKNAEDTRSRRSRTYLGNLEAVATFYAIGNEGHVPFAVIQRAYPES